ncbi:hypothetical protein GCM10009821_21200 [Aeromicrobium halocynthiae]|uniref:Uncharacterized protein n=1 Tax=Aeromicrobium halocynthiae TaxID=560557 RepID=A0ABN2W186_9ACTN
MMSDCRSVNDVTARVRTANVIRCRARDDVTEASFRSTAGLGARDSSQGAPIKWLQSATL